MAQHDEDSVRKPYRIGSLSCRYTCDRKALSSKLVKTFPAFSDIPSIYDIYIYP